jgi:hydroxyethylthiazole kinase-like sugar kinase family protein
MNRFLRTFLLSTIPTIGGLTFTGCATRTEVAQVRSQAEEALRNADKALILAQEANERATHSEEMVERSFRHSMRK